MRATGTSQRDHTIAAIIVVVVHLVLAWGLSRMLRAYYAPVADDAHVTEIQFVPRAQPLSAARAAGRPLAVAPVREREPARAVPNDPKEQRPAPENAAPSGTLSAVLLDQARQWAEQQARAEAEPVDAFARTHPLANDGLRPTRTRFRFREPLSAAAIVNSVGKAFSPPGYEADPCLQNRRNISELAPLGDSAALRHDVEFERRHCRP
ncbi:hypothetical protein [Lysobacter niastensis]|uniref:Energy transducer TonB n=1 Tax=Lysobacter niastensis TaxID=380629 RepID=A0ABS0BBS0_9GAMM|nr:hypothetical protein [Lysobacter niastensis]MBF6025191.1 hypothetical protein [Lysobacter niastensis]